MCAATAWPGGCELVRFIGRALIAQDVAGASDPRFVQEGILVGAHRRTIYSIDWCSYRPPPPACTASLCAAALLPHITLSGMLCALQLSMR